jgi:hypothetical protein
VRRLAAVIEAEAALLDTFGPAGSPTQQAGPSTPKPDLA